MLLAYHRAHKPPPAERIGAASFIHQAKSEEEYKRLFKEFQAQRWRHWNAQYLVGLAFVPVKGIALAAACIAVWRTLTQRFGFPIQPGHWLLVVAAGIVFWAAIRPYFQSLHSHEVGESISTAVATCMTAVVAYSNRTRLRWCGAFSLLAAGFGTVTLSFLLLSLSPSVQPSNLMGLGLLLLAAFSIAVLVSLAVDITEREQYDVFHWIGIATVLGLAGSVVAAMVAPRLIS